MTPAGRARIPGQAIAQHQKIVARVERYVRAHHDAPITIDCLCRMVGCKERALRNAFYGVHGISPKRWIVSERLMRARTALAASLGATTVTAVATELGFYQLGRFAAIYRQRFGEMPSGTLRAASRVRATQHHLTRVVNS